MTIHPNVFHDVLDRVPAGEWQVVQDGEQLRLLVAGPGSEFDGPAVVNAIRGGLAAAGTTIVGVAWETVAAIPRTTVGKAPLVRADPSVPRSDSEPAAVAPV